MDRRIKKTEGVDRPYRAALLDFQRSWWEERLARNGGSVRAAAREAGEKPSVVYKLLAGIGVRQPALPHRGNWGDMTA